MAIIRTRLILFVSCGSGLIILAAKLASLPENWRGVLVIGGGWLMAIGGLYQVKMYAIQRDIAYYVIVTFVSIYWACLVSITLFWFATLIGWA